MTLIYSSSEHDSVRQRVVGEFAEIVELRGVAFVIAGDRDKAFASAPTP